MPFALKSASIPAPTDGAGSVAVGWLVEVGLVVETEAEAEAGAEAEAVTDCVVVGAAVVESITVDDVSGALVGVVDRVDALVAEDITSTAEDEEGLWRHGPAMAPIGARRYVNVAGFIFPGFNERRFN